MWGAIDLVLPALLNRCDPKTESWRFSFTCIWKQTNLLPPEHLCDKYFFTLPAVAAVEP
jgi:hypothetical protein